MYMLISSGPFTDRKLREHSVATAFASSVLPVPAPTRGLHNVRLLQAKSAVASRLRSDRCFLWEVGSHRMDLAVMRLCVPTTQTIRMTASIAWFDPHHGQPGHHVIHRLSGLTLCPDP